MGIQSKLIDSAYRVNKGNWVLYNATSAATLTLTGTLPTVSFRCKVTLSATTGHTDVAGTITIGTETLTFTVATSKTTTVLLSALPVVTTSGLDCNILIEAIDSGGHPISQDTQTAIDCRFQDTQKAFQNAQGEWSTSAAIAYTNDTSLTIGKVFSYDGYDYSIDRIDVTRNRMGLEQLRKVWLTGKTVAPSTRSVAIATEAVTVTNYMLKSVYDTDADGIADKAESIRDLDTLPVSPTEGEIVAKDGKLYIAVTS